MVSVAVPNGPQEEIPLSPPGVWFPRTSPTSLGPTREEIRALRQRVLGVQEEERQKISRELHDGAGQLLSAAIFRVDFCAAKVGAQHPEVGAVLKDAREALVACVEAIHDLAVGLRPPMLEDLGLGPTIDWCARQFSAKVATSVDLKTSLPEDLIPIEVRTAAFRIVQEALANVVKHAAAAHVKVYLRVVGPWLALVVRDDGRGFDPCEKTRPSGRRPPLGIVGMRERAELLGGRFRILSAPGRGTLVYARFPLRPSSS